jgi:oxygen-dependent protoporphyrinogen oxidase
LSRCGLDICEAARVSLHSVSDTSVVVIGGGVSGLAAAWRLVQRAPGVRVTVLEQSDRVGGDLRTEVLDADSGLVVDVGAEAMLARRPEAVELVEEVGLGDDLVHPATTRAAIWSRGALQPMPAGTVMGVPGDPSSLAGVLTPEEIAVVAREPALPAPPTHGDVDVASFVAGRMGQAVVDRLVEPLLGGVYAGHSARLSLQATVPVLWPAAVHGQSLLDTVRQHGVSSGSAGTAAGSSAAPVFAGIRGGVGRLVDALRDRLTEAGAEVRTGACAQVLRAGSMSGWEVELGPAGRGETLHADAVVVALPARRAGRLLGEVSPDAGRLLGDVPTASMAVATFLLPGSVLDGHELSGVLVPPVEGLLVKGATFSSRKWEWVHEAAGGQAVVRASIGRAGDEAELQVPDEELLKRAADELSQILRRPMPVRASLLTRWGGALPQYEVGHVDRVEQVRGAVGELRGLAVAGATYDGVGIPACVASADVAVEKVLADLG